jgi:hypothetical protein
MTKPIDLTRFAPKSHTMKQIIIRYGLIAGSIVGAGLLISMLLFKLQILNMDYGAVFGYSMQLIAFTSIYFGIKKYRDEVGHGNIRFGKAFGLGLSIAFIAGIIYCVTWEIYFQATGQKFIAEYSEMYLEKMKERGVGEQEFTAAQAEMTQFAEMYRNPLVRFAFTLLEIIPLGVLVSLISALLLKRRQNNTTKQE